MKNESMSPITSRILMYFKKNAINIKFSEELHSDM